MAQDIDMILILFKRFFFVTHLSFKYRVTTLLSTAYKVLTRVIRRKLESVYEEILEQYQCGFRKESTTTDQLFSMRHILAKL